MRRFQLIVFIALALMLTPIEIYALACGTLGTANTTYTMTGNVSNGAASCFTVSANNVTLDCAGYSIIGNGTNYGITASSEVNDTTIKNCEIKGFYVGVYFDEPYSQRFNMSNLSIYNASGNDIYINYCTNCSISNSSLIGNAGGSALLSDGQDSASGFVADNIFIDSNGYQDAIYIHSTNATIKNSRFVGPRGLVVWASDGGGRAPGGKLINSTLNSSGTFNSYFLRMDSDNSLIENNTMIYNTNDVGEFSYAINVIYSDPTNVTIRLNNISMPNKGAAVIHFAPTTKGNTVCLNNISAASAVYINDTNGSNLYNCTYNGQNQGNIYANTNSSNLTGTVQSATFSNYKIATGGNSYPYNGSTSGGKFNCNFNGCGDYAPLFYSPSDPCVYSGSGDWIINGADNCVIGQSVNVSGSIKFSGSGNVTFYNASLSKIKLNSTAGAPSWISGLSLLVKYITKTLWLH